MTLAICVLAFALRAYRLDGQSLWGDEAYSVWRAGLGLAELTREGLREGTLPPLYYYALHFWLLIAGRSEYALRFLSLAPGLLTVPLLYALLRRVLHPPGPICGALVAALAPFLVYYSQETRMYAQATFWAVLATYLLLRLLGYDEAQGGRRQRSSWWHIGGWLAYGVAGALAVLSHYYAGFVLLAHAAYFGWHWWRHRRGLRWWAASQALAMLLIAPWILYDWSALGRTAGLVSRASVPLETIASRVAVAFSLGLSVSKDETAWLVPLYLALAALGLAALPPRRRALLPLYLGVPVLITYLVSFTPMRDWPRYFIMASPAYYGLIGSGLGALWRRHRALGLVGLVAVVAASGLSLSNYYLDPRYARFDFRSQVAKVVASNGVNEGIVVNGRPEMAFFYYFQGERPFTVVPRPGLEAESDVKGELERFVRGRSGLWLVKSMPPDNDPDNAIELWLAQHAYRLSQVWVENVTFTHYSLPAISMEPESAAHRPVQANFDDRVTLLSYAVDRSSITSGDTVHVALHWQAQKALEEDYTVFVHLVGEGERKVAQSDSQPAADMLPTRAWAAGDGAWDLRALQVASDAPPGEYRLVVGLYRSANGERLRLLREDRPPSTQLQLATITVRRTEDYCTSCSRN